jgi:hypothetical protein
MENMSDVSSAPALTSINTDFSCIYFAFSTWLHFGKSKIKNVPYFYSVCHHFVQRYPDAIHTEEID